MTKNDDHSIYKAFVSITETSEEGIVDRYQDTYTGSDHKVTEEDIIEWGKKLLDYARTPGNHKISGFYLENNIPRATFYRWRKNWPHFKSAIAAANELIGNRREELGLQKDSSFVYKTMKRYDKWYRKQEELEHQRKIQLKKTSDEEEKKKSIKITIEDLFVKSHTKEPDDVD